MKVRKVKSIPLDITLADSLLKRPNPGTRTVLVPSPTGAKVVTACLLDREGTTILVGSSTYKNKWNVSISLAYYI